MSAAARLALAAYVPARTRAWEDYTRLFVVGDDIGWSIDDDRARLVSTAGRLGYRVGSNAFLRFARRQAVFQHNHFNALQPRWLESSHRLGLSYFHGRPDTAGYPEFDRAYETLQQHAGRIDRVQVTHAEMRELVVGAGVPAERVFQIPIGVDLEHFSLGPARTGDDFVIGSFLKDGVGMGDGLEPKLLKGPDTFVAVVARLRESIPNLSVLLTGPARGFVRGELERLGIAHRHVLAGSRDELAQAYHAVDVCLVTSRQEGGPKSVLEAMATGVPLVTTRVGQAAELVVDEENGLLADVDDVDRLVDAVERVHRDTELRKRLRGAGRATAEAHAEERLDPLWANLLEGFVRRV
jgi:glycosyltransferase involved in cell wall biosynthesis